MRSSSLSESIIRWFALMTIAQGLPCLELKCLSFALVEERGRQPDVHSRLLGLEIRFRAPQFDVLESSTLLEYFSS